jgi:S-adenosylmethionine:tRNA ribosyltransferase-isomerase
VSLCVFRAPLQSTFNPVEVEDLSKHKMDSEELKITQAACDIVNDAKYARNVFVMVSMRAVESSVSSHGTLNPFDGWTNKFVFPPHEFTIPTCMITNFHAKIYFINDGICILWT